MSRPAIIVENLSKSYRLGHATQALPTFREAVMRGGRRSPWRRLPRGEEAGEPRTNLLGAEGRLLRGPARARSSASSAATAPARSTLLKILSRITEPTAGCVRLRGRVASLLEVGTGFHPELTGRENIYLNGAILGMRKAEIDRKFDEIVAFAEIEKFLDTPVKRYSCGMYVRLAFAVAAHLEPEILIVDEVLAVGDAAFQKKCLGKMQDVATERRPDRPVRQPQPDDRSDRSADRAIWLDNGRVKQYGPVGPTVEAYLTSMLGDGEQQSYYDLDRCDRHIKNLAKLRLRRLSFNGGDPVRHGCPLEVEIEYECALRCRGGFLRGRFLLVRGGRILTLDTDVPGPRFTIKKGTIGVVEMRLEDLQLQPGRYFLDAGSRSGDRNVLDLLKGFAQIEVLGGPDTPAVLIGWETSLSVRAKVDCRNRIIDNQLISSGLP